MKKIHIILLALGIAPDLYAQNGDELLVYSLKGNVTVLENNKESKLKIGKVLKPGATIKTQKLAKLTMVCKEGKPISLIKEGSFPVTIWKDSCATPGGSVSSKYFQYIWDQLYTRSDDYKRTHQDEYGTVGAPVRGPETYEIIIPEQFDSLYYSGGSFPLSWTSSFGYKGRYHFVLVNNSTGKIVYKDSITANTRKLDKLKKYMKQGQYYSWSVSTPKTGLYEGGVIRYVPASEAVSFIKSQPVSIEVPEAQAAHYFRIAYMLEQQHYLPEALSYYKKANTADPATTFYKEKLDEFRKTFFVR